MKTGIEILANETNLPETIIQNELDSTIALLTVNQALSAIRVYHEQFSWRGVETPPENKQRCLVACGDRVFWNSFEFWINPNDNTDTKFLNYDYPFGVHEPTHWIPMPQLASPPKQ